MMGTAKGKRTPAAKVTGRNWQLIGRGVAKRLAPQTAAKKLTADWTWRGMRYLVPKARCRELGQDAAVEGNGSTMATGHVSLGRQANVNVYTGEQTPDDSEPARR